MKIIAVYGSGFLSIAGFLIYVATFNILWDKYTNEPLNDIFSMLLIPVLAPAAVLAILFLPFLIGASVLGLG